MAENDKQTRRSFLSRLWMGAGLFLSYGTAAFYGFNFLSPRFRKPQPRRILVTSADKLPPGASTTFKDLSGRKIVLVNSGNGFIALSTTCTHLGCSTYWVPEKSHSFCPCHDGYFDVNGNVVSGPPPRPLDKFEVFVDENDNVFVEVREA